MININFVGDLCLQGIDSKKFRIPDYILSIFRNGDLNIANLESPLTSKQSIEIDTPVALKSVPRKNKILDLFHVFSLANNHILDYGAQGFLDTVSFLKGIGKGYFGAGTDLENAFYPLVLEKNNQKIAFLGFTRWANARKNQPGTTPADWKKLPRVIKNLKQDHFFVIIMPHWNYEYVYFPAPDNRRLARKLIDAGADLIVGSHPHIIQGYEKYKNKYIFHSLGNFIFHSHVFKSISMIEDDPRLKLTFVLSVTLENDFDYKINVTPLLTDDHQIRLLTKKENVSFEKKIVNISDILKNEKKYRIHFYRDAADISRQTTKMLKKMRNEQGMKNLFFTLKRVKKQDIKVVLHSFLNKMNSNQQD